MSNPSPPQLPAPQSATAEEPTLLEAEAELRRYSRYAGICLGGAAVCWLGSHALPLSEGVALPLRAVAEAGMVGGLADWFAVTALFRHPLGIPIPHTALVPRNRDRIAGGIARYIDKEFLNPETLIIQLRKLDLAARLSRKLDEAETRARLVDIVMDALPALIREEREAAIRSTLATAVRDGLKQVDLRPTLARLTRAVVVSDAMESMIRDLADRLIHLITTRKPWLETRVAEKSPWWVPSFVDSRLAETIANGVAAHIYDLRNPSSDAGRDMRLWLRQVADGIETGSPLGQRMAQAVSGFIAEDKFEELLHRALDGVRQTALADMANPEGRIRQAVTGIVISLTEQLHDPALRARIDASIEDAFRSSLPKWRLRIVDFIAATLRAQPLEQFTARLETRVGKDLQFIRINGTILGAFIGGLLYVVNLALH